MSWIKQISLGKTVLFAASCALLAAGAAPAQDALAPAPVERLPEIEINRDARDLQAEVRPRPVDRDVVDTALVFTNLGGEDRRVRCVGFDHEGRKVGRIWLKVPALGLRYALASDVSSHRDFIGSVQCGAGPNVAGSVVLLGPGLTDLPVLQPQLDQAGRIRFPLVATY